jgi:hypothetical protein
MDGILDAFQIITNIVTTQFPDGTMYTHKNPCEIYTCTRFYLPHFKYVINSKHTTLQTPNHTPTNKSYFSRRGVQSIITLFPPPKLTHEETG